MKVIPACSPTDRAARSPRRARIPGASDRIFTDYAREGHVPGWPGASSSTDGSSHTGTFGVQDTITQAPVTPDSVFRIASMTKSFTAVAILSLRDAGKLSLDDPAETYVPELKGLAYPDQRLAAAHDPPPALARHGLPGGQPVGRPATRAVGRRRCPR